MRAGVVHLVEQRTPEWAALRLGRLCGSRAADMLATIKSGGYAASRKNLRVQLCLERVTGRSQERTFVSGPMQDGMEREAAAVAAYEALSGALIERVGYVSHTTLLAGTSPDGVINGGEGIAEIKAPIAATHFDYLRTNVIPDDYQKQITHALWITGAEWCDWVSYQPDFPEGLQLRIVRVPRDEEAIEVYEKAARAFLEEVEREVEVLRTLSGGWAVAAGAA